MAFELGELLSEARIFTQRFLLGIFFPTFSQILFLYVLFLKEIPDDLTGLFLLAGLATGIALVLERGAGRLIWTLAICGGHYSRHYTKHFGVGLKSELKEESSSQTVQERRGLIFLLKKAGGMDDELGFKAKQAYLAEFGESRSSSELEALGRDETDYLMAIFFLLYGLLDLALVWYLSNHAIDLEFYERDIIETSFLSNLLIAFFTIWVLIFILYLIQKRQRLNVRIFMNLPVPYLGREDDPRQSEYYVQSVEVLLDAHHGDEVMYEANKNFILNFRQRQFRRALKDGYYQFIAKNLTEEITATKEWKKASEELDLKDDQEERVRETAKQFLYEKFSQQPSLSFSGLNEIKEFFNLQKEMLEQLISPPDWEPENLSNVLKLEELMNNVFEGFQMLASDVFGVEQMTFANHIARLSQLDVLSPDERDILGNFRRLWQYLVPDGVVEAPSPIIEVEETVRLLNSTILLSLDICERLSQKESLSVDDLDSS